MQLQFTTCECGCGGFPKPSNRFLLKHHNHPEPERRFWAKVNKDGPIPEYHPELGSCWIWTGAKNWQGYGRFYISGSFDSNNIIIKQAHRFSYELLRGPIPADLEPDHLCRIRDCVHPWHLELVTSQENTLRGMKGRMVTQCLQGHLYTPENTAIHHGRRECRSCMRERNRKRLTATYWRNYRKKRKEEGRPIQWKKA